MRKSWICGLALISAMTAEPARAALPGSVVFPIHRGVLARLGRNPGLRAIVKLDVQKDGSIIHHSRCTGVFISDRHVLTAAHCFDEGTKTYLSVPHPRYGFIEPGPSEEVYASGEDLDLAIVRYPPGTFRGRPFELRFGDSELSRRLADPDGPRRFTFGYGQTEDGTTSDRLRYREMGVMRTDGDGAFRTDDVRRVDHGDSGGPVIVVEEDGDAYVVAVNHAYTEGDPTDQHFKPVSIGFYRGLREEGLDLPRARCIGPGTSMGGHLEGIDEPLCLLRPERPARLRGFATR